VAHRQWWVLHWAAGRGGACACQVQMHLPQGLGAAVLLGKHASLGLASLQSPVRCV